MMTIDFDLLSSADDVSITCIRLKDGGKKWELELYLPNGKQFKTTIEPDDPSMDEDDDHNLDVWCFCDYVDINFWRDHDWNGSEGRTDDYIRFSIYPVDEITIDNTDSWGFAELGSTFTNTNETPVRGVVEFKDEE
jgi:hypothetical protein